MMPEISSFMLRELYKKRHAEKAEKIREFLSSNGFQPFVRAEQPHDLEGKIVAIFGGTTTYDILFYNVGRMALHSEGYLVEGEMIWHS